jgi:thiamine-phosphate pyrophosphorylase
MKIEHTPALSFALRRAAQFAQQESSAEIAPAHLLRGLLAEGEGHCAALLRQAGFDDAGWRRSHGSDSQALSAEESERDVRLSGAVRHILTLARTEVSAIGEEGSLASDQVLLALLEHAHDVRSDLEGQGLNYEALRQSTTEQTAALVMDSPLLFEDPKEPIDAARIIDACANRAREALRVLEDHARFVLNDVFLTGLLKELRHGLGAALAATPGTVLLQARDTDQDVGVSLTAPQEHERSSLVHVVQANAKRLQEALRSLEEYGKVLSPSLGQAMERLRYQAYTLEKALVLGSEARQRLTGARLYVLVTEALCRASLEGTIREAVEGGADVIQLREKELDDRKLLLRARDVRQLTRRLGALFIVNDRPDIARLAEADGVHLGQDDLPVQEARRLLGPDALIGVSTHNLPQLRRAILEGASYVGVGPTFPSPTKAFAAFPGLDYLREVRAETSLPAFALGGITQENVAEVVAAGAERIAVGHAVCAAEDARAAARALKRALTRPPKLVSS